MALAQEAYKMMDEKFEEAPINEKTSSFLWVMGPDLLDMPFVPLPEITPETKLSKDVFREIFTAYPKPLQSIVALAGLSSAISPLMYSII